jgi:Bacterial Ig-like domain (group 3)
VPTGTVTFTDLTTSTTLASTVSLSAGVATVVASALLTGNHNIQAVYSPAGVFQMSGGSSAVTIGKANTSTALGLSGTTLTATVTPIAPGVGTPTGTVQFLNGTTVVGTGTLSGGTATLTPTVPASYSFTAVCSGDTNFNGSTFTSVTATASPILTLSGGPNPSTFGQAVSFTLRVTPASGSGTVQFLDGATPLGTATLSGGQASFVTPLLAPGSHTIIATYGESSAVVGQFVYGVAPTVSFSASPLTVAYGQTVTLTAQLGPAPPQGIAAPTGQILFRDYGLDLASASVSGGTATLQVTSLKPGQNQLAALYMGDKNWAAGISTTITVTVSAAPSSTTLVPTVVANQVVLTATVATTAQGLGAPTGTVQFVNTATNTPVATSTLSGGTASASFAASAATSVESLPIAAVYSGDANFSGSTSAPLPPMDNAAWNYSASFAPDEIASLYGITGLNGNNTATPPLTTR